MKKTINEMGVGGGGVAGAMGALGEDDLDMGAPGMGDEEVDMGDDDMDLPGMEEDEVGECVECDKDELLQTLEAVAAGEMAPEEAFEQLCANVEDEDMDDDDMDLGGMGDMGGMGMDDMGGGMPGGLENECMEDIRRIASMLTDDPDIMEAKAEKKDCPECGERKIQPSVSMCRECSKDHTAPPLEGGPMKKKKKLAD